MRMGDLTSPVDGKSDNRQDGTEFSWNNSMPDIPNRISVQDNPNEEAWKISFSPHRAFIKNHKGGAVQSIEPMDRPQRDTFLQKSTNWKDFVDATSPIVSSFLSKNKESNPSTDIDVLGAAVQKLTSDAESLALSKNTESEKSKGRSQRAGDSASIFAKQTAKSKMLAEINRRRRAKTEEERKGSKQSKDDLTRTTKTSCTVCGVGMADGPRNICKSCMSRQKRDKSREKNQTRELKLGAKSPPSLSPKKYESDSSETDTHTKDMYTAESPLKEEKPPEETPTRNRSMSLDIADSNTETSKKYSTPKRTHTDLGPNSLFSKSAQDKGMNEMNQIPPKQSSPKKGGSASYVAEPYPTTNLKRGPGSGCIPLECADKSNPEIPGIGTRVMKRSTTDSEIVSKSKLINKPLTSKEEQKAALVNSAGRQQVIEDSKKRGSPKSEKKDSINSHSRPSSQENINVGMKLERSKTVMGKINVDGDKKSVFELERTRKKEGSNVSAESEKSYSNKKFTNPGRSHTTIGDGHNKRQKNKGDWTKSKAGKRENSSSGMIKDNKKKVEKKTSPGEEDGKRVSFVEGESVKKIDNEEALITCIQRTFPQNLYDYKSEDGDESSDSEIDSDFTASQSTKISNVSSRSEIPEPIPARAVPRQSSRRESTGRDDQTRYAGSNNQLENSGPSTRMGSSSSGYGGHESIRSDEYESNYQMQRWSDEIVEYEATFENEGQDTDYEDGDLKENQSEASYSEKSYRTLDKIEEQSDEDISEADSEEDIYTIYPSKPEDSVLYTGVSNNSQEYLNYFDKPVAYNDSKSSQNEELYTMHHTPQTNDSSKSGVETYYNLDQKTVSTTAEYTETGFMENWTQAMLGNGDSARTYFNAYETDVDTGLSVLHPQNEKEKQYTESGKEWGFSTNENDDSSSSSGDEDDQIKCSDSWYTGGYYDDSKSESSMNNDDLIYFNDRAAKKLSESEIYTGELFSNAVAKGNDQTDMSMNNNITLEDNLIEGSNFWIISSRPQMHQMKWDHLSRMETNGNDDEMYPNPIEDPYGYGMVDENLTWPINNISNNNDSDDESPSTSSGFKGKFPMQIACKSDYTEYTPDLFATIKSSKPKKEIVLLGNKDFRKYDYPQREERVREEITSRRSCDSYKTDTLFFGDEPPKITKPPISKSPVEHKSLYFNNAFKPIMRVDRSPEPVRCSYPKDDDYQGGFFYATRYESNNNNNSDQDSESYTGCFRNEEEYKPTHDGLFNDKACSFVYQKRAPEPTPLYFCNATSKSYYDTEESVYAFEKKVEPKAKPIEVPKILKVGSIVVRDNVECEVDYAQNIDMDSQDVPKTWMRYDYGGDSNVADTSSYAQNVSFEDFGGAKPWAMEGCRAPWKMTKAGEKSKCKEETVSNKNANGSWKAAPDSSNVVAADWPSSNLLFDAQHWKKSYLRLSQNGSVDWRYQT